MPLGIGMGLSVGSGSGLPHASSWPSVSDIPPGMLVLDADGVKQCTLSAGTTWQTRVSAADNNWLSVCLHTPTGRLVAVANSGTGNRVMTSDETEKVLVTI